MVWRASFSLEQLEKCFIHCVAIGDDMHVQLDFVMLHNGCCYTIFILFI